MARSSHGPRQATTWAAEHNQRPLPRIVRLGRPANDNDSRFGPATRALSALFAAVVLTLALVHWGVI